MIAEAEALVSQALTGLRVESYRNDYEAKNSYETNLERLRDAKAKLKGFTGDRISQLHEKIDDVHRQWEKKYAERTTTEKGPTSDQTAAQEAWLRQLQAEDEVDQMDETVKKKKGKKNHHGRKGGGTDPDLTNAHDGQRSYKNDAHPPGMGERGSSLCHMVHPHSNAALDEEVMDEVATIKPSLRAKGLAETQASCKPASRSPARSPVPQRAVLATYSDILFGAIPPDALKGRCDVRLVENSPMAELSCTHPVRTTDFDGQATTVTVTMYRAILGCIANGPPTAQLSDPEAEGEKRKSRSPQASPQPQPQPQPQSNPTLYEDIDECVITSSEDGEDEDEKDQAEVAQVSERKRSKVFAKMGSEEYDVLNDASTALVAEYSTREEDLSATEDMLGGLPKVLLPPLEHILRLSMAPWIVVMCHGGYFAGAVFINCRPILHKAFHRYVVRKKQGGKQSSHDKGGGSGGSAGGQIRRAQEIKWKLTVRDILLSWRGYIDAAWVILYVAPGPENRAILSDFSLLPPPASGQREKSPINTKDDPRVRSAPLTTHRPSFKEVRRIYETVSCCTVRHHPLAPIPRGDSGS
jgi:hypothetical protein